ncbi:hypothetical protein IV102_13845 [bacterium]|nr:hypothetical protein [bacterium]
MAFIGSNQGMIRESTWIREALQQYRQAPDVESGLAVTKDALDQVVLRGNATEQQIAESTLDAVARCRILSESAAKTYEIALAAMLVAIPPTVGIATVLAQVGKQSMSQIDPSDGLRIGESFVDEAGRLGGRAEQTVATAGRALSDTLGPDGASEVLMSTLTTLTNEDRDLQPVRLTGTAQDGLLKLQDHVNRGLRWTSDDDVTPEEKARISDDLQTMVKTGRPSLAGRGDDLHFLIARG